MSLGYCFYPAILYLILGRDKRRVSDMLLLTIFSIALVLTHTIAALVMLLSMITIFIGIKLFKRIGKLSVSSIPIPLTLIAFFGLFMLFRWMQPDPNQSCQVSSV
jgi:uncharacterized BrkB/YihY/UPF0761 family membrane protein